MSNKQKQNIMSTLDNTYGLGDLVTFKTGFKGIVISVNPSGWPIVKVSNENYQIVPNSTKKLYKDEERENKVDSIEK